MVRNARPLYPAGFFYWRLHTWFTYHAGSLSQDNLGLYIILMPFFISMRGSPKPSFLPYEESHEAKVWFTYNIRYFYTNAV